MMGSTFVDIGNGEIMELHYLGDPPKKAAEYIVSAEFDGGSYDSRPCETEAEARAQYDAFIRLPEVRYATITDPQGVAIADYKRMSR